MIPTQNDFDTKNVPTQNYSNKNIPSQNNSDKKNDSDKKQF